MEASKIVFLLNESVTAVRAIYEPDAPATQPKSYVFKSFDPQIKVGDLAIVETNTRFGYTVVKIIEVDVDVDLESPTELKWLIQRLDTTGHERMLKDEAAAVEAVNAAARRKKRAELRDMMFKDQAEMVSSLAITHAGESEMVEPPAKPE
jgi:hypothetical protein